MMERLFINGEWYIKESLVNNQKTPNIDNEIIDTKHCSYENDDFHIEAFIITDENGDIKPHSEPYIIFKDKRHNTHTEDEWSNPIFLINIIKGEKEAIDEVKHLFNNNSLPTIQTFLKKLQDKGWLKEPNNIVA